MTVSRISSFLVPVLLFSVGGARVQAAGPVPPPQPPAAVEVSIGGRQIQVPLPEGFVRCDGVNPAWDKAMAATMPGTNRMLATFGTPENLQSITAGTPSDYERNLNLQVNRSIEAREVGDRTFDQMRNELKQGLEDMKSKLNAELAKLAASANKKMNEEFGADAGLSFSDTVVLGTFEDTSNSLGFTLAMNTGVKSADGRSVSRGVVAAIMTPVNGRLVNFYASAPYTGEADRQWVEKSVTAWKNAVVAANPKVAGQAFGFDWTRVGSSAVVGAVVGAIFGLVRWLGNRSRKKKEAGVQ